MSIRKSNKIGNYDVIRDQDGNSMEPLDDDPELSFDNEEYKELTRDVVNKQQSTGPILQDEEDNNFDDQSKDMEKLIPDENMNTIVTR